MACHPATDMKKSKHVTVFVLILAVVIAGVIWLKRELAIDGCLDSGGRWNYSLSQCEKA